MTEQEWLANTSPHRMLEYLNGIAGERKMRLFAVACCDYRAHLIRDERVLAALRFAEDLADTPVDQEAHINAYDAALEANDAAYKEWIRLPSGTPEEREARWQYELSYVTQTAVGDARPAAHEALLSMGWWANSGADPQHLALLHDVFGNPFRGVSADPAWLTSTVVELARSIYDDRAFDRLPILADALQDAGCANVDVLNHCCEAGPHARGCWVVDLILGKQ